ncbi:2-phospho-L-lactate transferase [Hoeflea sp. TYP-13]|uniref:2-phospho-L-lactate transferase n=1 Tax=Hoeflea sp. TYP-13 TaxID=3230023 RepID=UPI0034C64CF4
MSNDRILALSGGVGGAKLVLGLSHALPAERLLVVTNTGDDFDHFGLRICPDTDTVIYTLSDLADRERGWGRAGESWGFMEAMRQIGGEDWFNLGDRDLALHVLRTDRLNKGSSLSAVTAEISDALGIKIPILPMCDQPVATMVDTPEGRLAFQHYFVRERCAPTVTGFEFEGIEKAQPNPAVVAALKENPAVIIIAPSNPFVSVAPILAVPELSNMLRKSGAPIVAVSPIVGGEALKGPAAKMMKELGMPASALEIARHYRGFIDGLVIDEMDAELAPAIADLGMEVEVAPTIMNDLNDRIELANRTVGFAARLSGGIER